MLDKITKGLAIPKLIANAALLMSVGVALMGCSQNTSPPATPQSSTPSASSHNSSAASDPDLSSNKAAASVLTEENPSCTDGAVKGLKIYGIATGILATLDCVFAGCAFTAAAVSTGAAPMLLLKGGATAAALGCADKLVDEDPKGKPIENGGTGGFLITNKCHHPVRVAIHYRGLDNNWISEGWWDVSGSTSSYLAGDDSKRKLMTSAERWYFYAESTNETNLIWKGDQIKQFGSVELPMRELRDSEGDSEWTLSC